MYTVNVLSIFVHMLIILIPLKHNELLADNSSEALICMSLSYVLLDSGGCLPLFVYHFHDFIPACNY